jgi:DNA invertase Pin-like site-specific DNA recombinase
MCCGQARAVRCVLASLTSSASRALSWGVSQPARRCNECVAVANLRVSTDRQELGPEAQRAAIEAWARAGDVQLAVVVKERLSGATPLERRPGFAAALVAAREHGAALIVVARRDRLACDVVVAALAARAALAAGASIVSADGAGNGLSEADAFMRSMLDAASAYERALIRARTRGRWPQRKPAASASAGCPTASEPKGRPLCPNPASKPSSPGRERFGPMSVRSHGSPASSVPRAGRPAREVAGTRHRSAGCSPQTRR